MIANILFKILSFLQLSLIFSRVPVLHRHLFVRNTFQPYTAIGSYTHINCMIQAPSLYSALAYFPYF
jgi:hypothetical protein